MSRFAFWTRPLLCKEPVSRLSSGVMSCPATQSSCADVVDGAHRLEIWLKTKSPKSVCLRLVCVPFQIGVVVLKMKRIFPEPDELAGMSSGVAKLTATDVAGAATGEPPGHVPGLTQSALVWQLRVGSLLQTARMLVQTTFEVSFVKDPLDRYWILISFIGLLGGSQVLWVHVVGLLSRTVRLVISSENAQELLNVFCSR